MYIKIGNRKKHIFFQLHTVSRMYAPPRERTTASVTIYYNVRRTITVRINPSHPPPRRQAIFNTVILVKAHFDPQ